MSAPVRRRRRQEIQRVLTALIALAATACAPMAPLPAIQPGDEDLHFSATGIVKIDAQSARDAFLERIDDEAIECPDDCPAGIRLRPGTHRVLIRDQRVTNPSRVPQTTVEIYVEARHTYAVKRLPDARGNGLASAFGIVDLGEPAAR